MSWARLDDGFHSHAKPLSCSLGAVGLYTMALSWSSAQETDGHIPAHMALYLARGDQSLCDELVRSHLWEATVTGYDVHDYLVFNPSAKSLDRKRKAHAKVMRSWRKRDQSRETHGRLPSTGREGMGSTPPVSSSPGSVLGGGAGEGFDRFWAVYPNRLKKGAARVAWAKIKPSPALVDTIIASVELHREHCAQWHRNGGEFIPHPATWLNARGWEDDPMPPTLPAPTTSKTRDREQRNLTMLKNMVTGG